MLAAGVTVGLGSDSMASNNRMDMLEEARLALLAQRARTASSESPSAVDVLELATIGGAPASWPWRGAHSYSMAGSRHPAPDSPAACASSAPRAGNGSIPAARCAA